MADNLNRFQHGATVFPLPSATTNGLLKDADPALFYVLDFYTTILNAHLSTRLAAEATLIGYTGITAAVKTSLPYHPGPFLTESQTAFPVLAVYRKSETHTERTLSWRMTNAQWAVSYVLPPLNAMQAERLAPALNAAKVIIENRTEIGFDPNWTSGANVFRSSYANLEGIDVTGSQFELWDLGQQLPFHALTISLSVRERQMPASGAFESMAGIDTSFALPDQIDGESVVEVQTETD